ncbi:MAG: UDP-N-acetylglucosamine 2-epimerase (non-hydrolyzing) [Candidatus Omnitrophota bacterium]
MKKILTVVGARPQLIKSKPLSELFKREKGYCEVFVHTGQHYDYQMSQVFFEELSLPQPDYFLNVSGGDNLTQVKRMVKKINSVIAKECPDLVLVYGDTNSTLAGALAAKCNNLPLAHVEAGVRSFNMGMAEEINRVIVDKLADLLFLPVKEAISNLRKEGINKNVYLVGDVLYELVVKFKPQLKSTFRTLAKEYSLRRGEYCLVTIHRAELVENKKYLSAVLKVISKVPYPIVFPIHPRTKKKIRQFGLQKLLSGVICLEPQSYLKSLSLIKNARSVITDSGGVQREAYFLKTPCVTLRNQTEWPQTFLAGWNVLVPVHFLSLKKLADIIVGRLRPKKMPVCFCQRKVSNLIFKIIDKFLFN